MKMEILIDKIIPECTYICTDSWIRERLGKPLEIPFAVESWASEQEKQFLEYFESMTGKVYAAVLRDNTYNSENSLSSNFVFTVFAPIDCLDWEYSDEVYIIIERHLGGDVRGNYGSAELYRLDNPADVGFFDRTLGWYVEDSHGNNLDDCGRYSAGYSTYPFGELERDLKAGFLQWSDRFGCFVGILSGKFAKIYPSEY